MKVEWPSWAPVPNKSTVSVDVKQRSAIAFQLVPYLLCLLLFAFVFLAECSLLLYDSPPARTTGLHGH